MPAAPPVADADTAAQRLEALGLTLPEGLTYDPGSLFRRLKGLGSTGDVKRRVKLLRKLEPALRGLLGEGETILYVTHGVRSSLAEQYFMGILFAHLINRTAFVFTAARVVMIQLEGGQRPRPTIWSVFYSQIETLTPTWNGHLKLKLRDGTRMSFTGMPKRDRRVVAEAAATVRDTFRETGFDPEVTRSQETICCHCFAAVPAETFHCPECDAEYWRPSELAWRSFLFPSWGDILMRHRFIAAFEAIAGIGTWSYLIVAIVQLVNAGGVPAEPLLPGAVIAFVIFNGIDATLIRGIASKGLQPKRWPAW